jgi:hypothetical protein
MVAVQNGASTEVVRLLLDNKADAFAKSQVCADGILHF